MTDTTDTAAVSEQFKSIRDDVEFYEGTQHCIAVPIKLAKALLGQLEAERQRADKAEADMQFECDAHIDTAESWREWKLRAITAAEEIAALKAKLANPVVLPNRRDSDPAILTYTDAIKAINEAGFTVKGE